MTRITTIIYNILPVLIFRFFFHLTFLVIGSHIVFLYTWSTQQVTVAQHKKNIRTGDTHGFYKGHSSKFHVGSRIRIRQTPEEGWRTYRLKRCWNNNKDKDNSPKINLNDKNHQASSQKFRQLIQISVLISQQGEANRNTRDEQQI